MASYRDEYYSVVDQVFNNLKRDPFNTPVGDPTKYEVSPPGNVSPIGWVKNADKDDGTASVTIDNTGITILNGKINVKNSGGGFIIEDGVVREVENDGADVTIDADGITILNGAISLEDYGGQSVLGPAGFGGSWVNFITTNMYNSYFGYGTLSTNFTVSETGGADTIAEYEASLSDELPYWVISARSGNLQLVTDSDASYGKAVKWSGSTFDGTIYQDFPVVPGHKYNVVYAWKYLQGIGGEFQKVDSFSWRDSNHAIIGSEVNDALSHNAATSSGYINEHSSTTSSKAPENAAFLRVKVRMATITGGHSTQVWLGGIRAYESSHYGPIEIEANETGTDLLKIVTTDDTFPRLNIESGGAITWGSGSAVPDVSLNRTAANVLTLSAGDRFDTDVVGRAVYRTSAISVGGSLAKITNYQSTDFSSTFVTYNSYGGGELRALVAGVYIISVSATFEANSSGRRVLAILRANGRTPTTSDFNTEDFQIMPASPVGDTNTCLTVIRQLAVNDTIAVGCSNSSGSLLEVQPVVLSMVRVGV